MHETAGSHLIARHRITAHVVLPALVSAWLLGFYFSGSPSLQEIVAPSVPSLQVYSWREFGAVEQLQNFVLIVLIAVLVHAVWRMPGRVTRAALAMFLVLFVFTLLEEIDYGAHFLDWFRGESGSLEAATWNRNLHNRMTAEGVQYSSYMKLGVNVLVAVAFFVLPVFAPPARALARLLWPSRWLIASTLLMVLVSWFAHELDDAGLSVIDGVPGNLEDNISEFRELNLYYLFLLYFVELSGRMAARPPGSGCDSPGTVLSRRQRC